MFNTLFSALQQAYLRIIAPPFCRYCKAFLSTDAIFCTYCSELIQHIVSAPLIIGKHTTISVYALSAYKDPIKRLVLAKGSRDILASKQLGHLIWDYTYISFLDFDCIVPIPLHWTRYMVRGYNQAHEIASVLAQKSQKPVVSCLKRFKKTQYQAALSAEQRKKNIEKVFSITPERLTLVKDRHILLVDDLMTTGATLHEAIKVLLEYKPKKISVVVAARVV